MPRSLVYFLWWEAQLLASQHKAIVLYLLSRMSLGHFMKQSPCPALPSLQSAWQELLPWLEPDHFLRQGDGLTSSCEQEGIAWGFIVFWYKCCHLSPLGGRTTRWAAFIQNDGKYVNIQNYPEKNVALDCFLCWSSRKGICQQKTFDSHWAGAFVFVPF